jgi:putative Mn2+ efflux pump MntP
MIGSSAWTVVAAALCLGTGVACLALAASGVGDRAAQLAHAVMGVAMAGMFSPWGDPVPGWIGALLFTVVGAWFVAADLRHTAVARAARHLGISSVAMVLMYLMHHHPDGMSGGAGSGAHAGHAMAGGGTSSLVVLPLALVLAGYFVWHTWTCVERSRAPVPSCSTGTAQAEAPTTARTTARLEPVAHGVMSALMAAMFLTAI